jgi:hypothetical protein
MSATATVAVVTLTPWVEQKQIEVVCVCVCLYLCVFVFVCVCVGGCGVGGWVGVGVRCGGATSSSIMTFSKSTLSIKGLFMKVSISYTQRTNELHYAEFHILFIAYAKCRYAECYGAGVAPRQVYIQLHLHSNTTPQLSY